MGPAWTMGPWVGPGPSAHGPGPGPWAHGPGPWTMGLGQAQAPPGDYWARAVTVGIFSAKKLTVLIKSLVLVGTLPQALFSHQKVTFSIKSLVLVGTSPQALFSSENI